MRGMWKVVGGMRNVKARGRIYEEGFTRKEEGVRRKEKCESARKCVEGMRGMWKVECGMRNVHSRGRIYEEGVRRKEEGEM